MAGYSVDGNAHQVIRNSDTAWRATLSRFQALASTHLDGSMG